MFSEFERLTTLGFQSFSRSVVHEDWERFNKYAHRVRSIGRNPYLGTLPRYLVLHRSILDGFESAKLDGLSSLLPRLEHLDILTGREPTHSQLLRLLMGPTLKQFSLIARETDVSEVEAIFWVQALWRCPSLIHLTLYLPPFESVAEMVGDMIYDLRSLRVLSARPFVIPPTELSSLQEICFYIDGPTPRTFLAETGHFMPSLVAVVAAARDLNLVNPFISSITSRSFQTIHTPVLSPPTATDIHQFILTLRSIRPNPDLQILSITTDTSRTGLDPPRTVEPFVLRPLMAFRGLRELTIALPNHLVLDDAFIKDVASAWSELRKLEMIGAWPWPRKITLGGLIPLAYECPHLSILALVIDATSPPSQRSPTNALSKCALTRFALEDSHIQSVEEVAAYLSDMFPSLSCINPTDSDIDPESYYKWDRVGELVPLFARIRKEERERVQKP